MDVHQQDIWTKGFDSYLYGFHVPQGRHGHMATWPRIQDHDIDVIYLEVTRSKCRFLTRWTHPFRCAKGWAWQGVFGMAVP